MRVNHTAVIMLFSGLFQFMKEMSSEDTPSLLLRSPCHPLRRETCTSHDQSPTLTFLSNAQKLGMSNAVCLSWISSPPLAVSLTALSGIL